jgi:hypothetical protein
MEIPNGVYANLVKIQQFETSKSTNYVKEAYEEPTEAFDSTSLMRSSLRSSIRGIPTARMSVVRDENVKFSVKYKGLLHLYKNCHGNYGKLAFGTLFALLFGLEIPGSVLIMNQAFIIFQNKSFSWDLYQQKIFWMFVSSAGLAALCCLSIFGAISIYGWATENVVDNLKMRAFRNVLRQAGSYFDYPQNSNAKIIRRINTDTVSVKAALDNRLYHFVNNMNSSILQVILSLFYSIQVSLIGTGMYGVLAGILWFISHKIRHSIHMLHLVDDSAKVGFKNKQSLCMILFFLYEVIKK